MSNSDIKPTFPIKKPADTIDEFLTNQPTATMGVEHEMQLTNTYGLPMDNGEQTALRNAYLEELSAEAGAHMIEVKTGAYEARDAHLVAAEIKAKHDAVTLAADRLGLHVSSHSILKHMSFEQLWANIYNNPRCNIFLDHFKKAGKESIGDYFLSVSGDQISVAATTAEEQWRVYKILAFLSPYLCAVTNNSAPDTSISSLQRRVSATGAAPDSGMPASFWKSSSADEFFERYNEEIWNTELFSYHTESGQLIPHRLHDGIRTLKTLPPRLQTYRNFEHASSIQWQLLTLASIPGEVGQPNKGRRIEIRCLDSQSDHGIRDGLIHFCGALTDNRRVQDQLHDLLGIQGFDIDAPPSKNLMSFRLSVGMGLATSDYANSPYGTSDYKAFARRLLPLLADIQGTEKLAEIVDQTTSPALQARKLAMS